MAVAQQKKAVTKAARTGLTHRGLVHPVIIYPFKQAEDYSDLKALYESGGAVGRRKRHLCPPDHGNRPEDAFPDGAGQGFPGFQEKGRRSLLRYPGRVVRGYVPDVVYGAGAAFEKGRPGDVYWLIPGDFNYGTSMGREVRGACTTCRRLSSNWNRTCASARSPPTTATPSN